MLAWLKNRIPTQKGVHPVQPAQAAPAEAAGAQAAALKSKGNAFLDEDRLDAAAECYRQAAELDPRDAGALTNLGFVLTQQNRFAEAEPVLRRAVDADPRSHDAFYLLGSALKRQGRLAEASEAFENALKLEPGFAVCLRDLCLLQLDGRNFAKARLLAETGVRLHPEHADFHYYLGTVLHEYREFDKAKSCLQKALALHPDYAHVHNNLGNTLLEQGLMDAAIQSYREALALNPAYIDAHSNLLFALNYHPDLAAEDIFTAYQQYDQALGLPQRALGREHGNERNPHRRLKVGYMSPDFHQHSIRHFLEPLMAHHDKEVVEVFAYAEQSGEDETTARYRQYADHWVPTQGMSDDALAQHIRDDRIDILVDLAGHTAGNRLSVFARKPAPVSVSWLGYGYTTGLSAIDHLLTDDVGAPAGCEHLFSERPWRLATPGYAFRPADGMGPVSALPAIERGYVSFGSLTRSVRINHRSIRVWSEILERVPRAHLVVNSKSYQDAATCASLKEKFTVLGIAAERLEFGFHSPPWDVLRGLDIGLDCFPHNSGTTLFETLYMGVPFVTLAGRPSVGRLGSSILHGVGRPEWIAQTEDEYIDRAVALACDLPALSVVRSQLRAEMEASPLRDEAAFARKTEVAYRRMFALWAGRSAFAP